MTFIILVILEYHCTSMWLSTKIQNQCNFIIWTTTMYFTSLYCASS